MSDGNKYLKEESFKLRICFVYEIVSRVFRVVSIRVCFFRIYWTVLSLHSVPIVAVGRISSWEAARRWYLCLVPLGDRKDVL